MKQHENQEGLLCDPNWRPSCRPKGEPQMPLAPPTLPTGNNWLTRIFSKRRRKEYQNFQSKLRKWLYKESLRKHVGGLPHKIFCGLEEGLLTYKKSWSGKFDIEPKSGGDDLKVTINNIMHGFSVAGRRLRDIEMRVAQSDYSEWYYFGRKGTEFTPGQPDEPWVNEIFSFCEVQEQEKERRKREIMRRKLRYVES